MKTNIGKTEQALLNMLANKLFTAERDVDTDSDTAQVWKEAYKQAVAVMVFSDFDLCNIDKNLGNEIKHSIKNLVTKNMFVSSAHARLDEMLGESGVQYTVLKGFASARYYPDPFLRSMGDVDFLVHGEDIEKASEIFINDGFEMSHENHDCHRVFIKGKIRYEMHFEPSGIPSGESGDRIREYLKDTIESSNTLMTDFGKMRVPDDFYHGLVILIHTAHHMTGGGIGLRQLCDWAVFVNSVSEDDFCDLFEQKLKEIGLWRFACLLTRTASYFLGCPEKKWAGEGEKELCESIIKDIFSSGNFGQKDETRSQGALLISKDGEKSGISQLISSMNRIVYQKWKISRRMKLFLPIGWIFFGLRYIIRMLMGKRPEIKAVKAINDAEKRTEIYRELGLYERM